MNLLTGKNILKQTGVLLILIIMVLSAIGVTADVPNGQLAYSPRLAADHGCMIGEQENVQVVNIERESSMADEIILFENFDETWVDDPDPEDPYKVPVGWDIDGICTGTQSGVPWATHYWRQFGDGAYPFTHSPPHCAGLWWSDGNYPDPSNGEQDEWLISPEMDVSGCRHMELAFYSVYTMLRYESGETAHDYIKVSTDGGDTWEVVADLAHDRAFDFDECSGGPGGYGWNWNEVPIVIDLSDYAGSDSLMIAFHYEVSGQETRGVWMVDDVQVTIIFMAELNIGYVAGGLFYINTLVANVGDANTTDVTWHISVEGGIMDKIKVSDEGTIHLLNISGTQEIKTKKPIFGLGKIAITITASSPDAATVTKTATGFALFCFVTNIIVQP